jgi:hypothetical protein
VRHVLYWHEQDSPEQEILIVLAQIECRLTPAKTHLDFQGDAD